MSTTVELVVTEQFDTSTNRVPPDRYNPAVVYLARLSIGSRPTMTDALDTIAGILTGGRFGATETKWSRVRYAEAQAVRTRLAHTYAPATANKILSALRGVMREAWRLGQIDGCTRR